MIALIMTGGLVAFIVAYNVYGKYLERIFGLHTDRRTPAHDLQDGRDFYPARAPVLLGHHFSSIAGAGPIVGPIFATLVFGWGPAVAWIVLGSIFVGGVHDYGSLAVSIRNGACTIAQVASQNMNRVATKLLLVFVWLTLVYVLIVFLDLTAATFAPRIADGADAARIAALVDSGGAVATSSLLFILLALALGVAMHRIGIPLATASLVFVPLIFVGIYIGQLFPLRADLLPAIKGSSTTTWTLLLLVYCFLASITPVWILLQPRDYLSSFLLYACLGLGLVGILSSSVTGEASLSLRYPIFLGFDSAKLGFLFPSLFITIACGACSGFHSVVASGTTARQLSRESDARIVGYGSMLLEGALALISVSTVAILALGSPETRASPPALFAAGLGRFLAVLGIPPHIGSSFSLLALSTFLLTTLDTGTRLGRYVLEELLELKGKSAVWLATVITLSLPVVFSMMTFEEGGKAIPIWRVIWPVFGSTNQLLGGLALMVVTVWLRRTNRPFLFTLLPMIFIISATVISLAQLALTNGISIIGIISTTLLVMAVVLVVESARALFVTENA